MRERRQSRNQRLLERTTSDSCRRRGRTDDLILEPACLPDDQVVEGTQESGGSQRQLRSESGLSGVCI